MVKGKLLVVDDDPSICEALRLIGEDCGYVVTTTESGKSFKESYATSPPDIITLDLSLGNYDGIELLRWLAFHSCQKKIILISAHDEKVIRSALLLGRSQHLNIIAAIQKPFDISTIKSLLLSPEIEGIQITEETIAAAIQNKDFLLFYQPKVEIKTGKLKGVEALVRWPIQGSSLLSPTSFIDIAEETGLISPLSSLVNYEVIKQCSEFYKKGLNIVVSINISPKLLSHLTLPDELYNIAEKFHLDLNKICIEITESAAMENAILSLDVLTRLRIKGISVSIDDFGTGYSSLEELQRMPFSELKIDKSFVIDLERESSEYIITRSVINLGHDLGLKVVAEGVQNKQTFEILKELDCDMAQGYYVGHPMHIREFYEWLKTNVNDELICKFIL